MPQTQPWIEAPAEEADKYHRRKRNAFQQAYEEGLYHDVSLSGQGGPTIAWRVPSRSRPGDLHTVTRFVRAGATPDDRFRYACTCEAGKYHAVCRHRAAVWIAQALGDGYSLEYSPRGDLEAVVRRELVKEYR